LLYTKRGLPRVPVVEGSNYPSSTGLDRSMIASSPPATRIRVNELVRNLTGNRHLCLFVVIALLNDNSLALNLACLRLC
jgi:hypothetical protein